MSEDDQGSFRFDDPATSVAAARSIKVGRIMRMIMTYLYQVKQPRNGWEMSEALELPTITVVPRLCPMRDDHGFIAVCGTRPGPSGRAQLAYVLTAKGEAFITGSGRNTTRLSNQD
jgi:hypothetical protein